MRRDDQAMLGRFQPREVGERPHPLGRAAEVQEQHVPAFANMEPRDISDPKYPEWEAHMDKVKGTADVIIAKQRHGPTGTVKLAFQSEFTRFADLAEPSFTQYEEH